MFTLKTQEEIELIREGGGILSYILDQVVKEVAPGVNTADLEDMACRMIEEAGGRPAFKDYEIFENGFFPTALCTSINEEIVHGPAKPGRILQEGDIIGIDCGMEYPVDIKRTGGELAYFVKKNNRRGPINKHSVYGGYYTDMAKTIAVGKIDSKVRELVQTTEESLYKAIKKIKPGNTLNDIGREVQKHAESRGFSVVRDLVGHGVGHDVHEEPQVFNYEISQHGFKDLVLEPGMVIAVEPMVNVGGHRIDVLDDNFTIVTADRSLSAHFEHTIAVTETGYEIMTVDRNK
jgi:methionyl aminopeptidase